MRQYRRETVRYRTRWGATLPVRVRWSRRIPVRCPSTASGSSPSSPSTAPPPSRAAESSILGCSGSSDSLVYSVLLRTPRPIVPVDSATTGERYRSRRYSSVSAAVFSSGPGSPTPRGRSSVESDRDRRPTSVALLDSEYRYQASRARREILVQRRNESRMPFSEQAVPTPATRTTNTIAPSTAAVVSGER